MGDGVAVDNALLMEWAWVLLMHAVCRQAEMATAPNALMVGILEAAALIASKDADEQGRVDQEGSMHGGMALEADPLLLESVRLMREWATYCMA